MNRIEEDISKQEYSRFYLLCGDEDYLKQFYRNKLKNALIREDDAINLNIWHDADFDLRQFEEQALTMPFFSDRRLIIVEDCGLFKKGGADLAAFLPSVPVETVIMFVEHETDAREKLYKTVKDLGVIVSCDRLKEAQLRSWIGRRLAKRGRRVQNAAVDLLLDRVGEDMQSLENEMEKLVAYTEGRDAVLLEDVQALTPVRSEVRIFELIDAIADRNQDKALRLYHDILEQKESALKILIMMGRQFDRILQVKELRDQSYDQATIAERLKLQGFVVRKTLNQASRFTPGQLKRAIARCVAADENIKTGRMKDVLAAEMAIIGIWNDGREPGPRG